MTERVVVDGKHLALAGRPFRVRGVTYGSFVPRLDGQPFPDRVRVKRDFLAMAEAGFNTLRTYDMPPADILDLADEHGLRVLAGLNYHDWRLEERPGRDARRRIRDSGRRAVASALECGATRETVLAIPIGNEVPADVVRVHGIGAVQEILSELAAELHDADARLLVTYANFPTTEFLDIEGLDLVAFNVFLEQPEQLRRYLRHLQVVAGNRPLLIGELGLAAEMHGARAQADSLREQLAIVDETGCAGATVFSWTDEWGVAGKPVTGWGFGITDAARQPKPAFDVVAEWAGTGLVDRREHWPRISVVVCAYNEDVTIRECLASLAASEYQALEVIVCDDGSTDRTLEIARRFPFKVLELEHGGLSCARNAGLEAATGDIVAYLDADASCHPEWPFYLALALEDDNVVAAGGPNLPVPGAGFVERAVALAPGSPAEVLIADDRAEHIPGCNMAYTRRALEGIGGFDHAYTAAGDDVDVCWKLLDRGSEIAFSPAAQVHHHRRSTVRGYLGQQRGYGRAERMLAGAHPHRFNRLGQARWTGFIYGGAAILPKLLRPVIYHGVMGGAPFQPLVRRRAEAAGMWLSAFLPLVLALGLVGAAFSWLSTWLLLLPAAALLTVLTYGFAVAAAVQLGRGEQHPIRMRSLVASLHVAQPFVRLWGRLRGRPLDRRPTAHPAWGGDRWAWLAFLETDLRRRRCSVRAGAPSHPWDLYVTMGPFVSARIATAVMWRWNPLHAVRYQMRSAFWLAFLVPAGVWAAGAAWPLALGLLGAILVGAAAEWVLLRTRVASAIAHATTGARA